MRKANQRVLRDCHLNEIVTQMQSLVPVYTIGKSLQDFVDHISKLSARELCDFTGCLYKLYRHADVAFEPYARDCDLEHLNK